MHQMIDPERFVSSEFNMQMCYKEDKEGTPDSFYFTESIVQNQAKTFFFAERKWNKVKDKVVSDKGASIPKYLEPSSFLGAFKTYSELDVIELRRIIA